MMMMRGNSFPCFEANASPLPIVQHSLPVGAFKANMRKLTKTASPYTNQPKPKPNPNPNPQDRLKQLTQN